MENVVAESALAGRAVLRLRSALRSGKPLAVTFDVSGAAVDPVQAADSHADPPSQAAKSGSRPVSVPPQFADVERVLSRVRSLLLSRQGPADAAVAALLRDSQFSAAWNNANAVMISFTPREHLLSPVVIDEPLRRAIGSYRDEVQGVAKAWGKVLEQAFSGELREELHDVEPARFLLPAYLDDDRLPIEVWEAIRARDAAAVCYIALVEGTELNVSPVLLADYAVWHCRYQRQWLDLFSWMFGVACPDVVPQIERQDWSKVFEEAKLAAKGLDALFEHAKARPDGFAVGDVSTARE